MAGSQALAPDPRNESILISVNGRLVPRAQAVVSVFDSAFIAGDGVWEGLRLHKGRLLFLDEHMARLERASRAIGLDIGLDLADLSGRIKSLLDANRMTDGVHLRLMVSRGEKSSPSQDPAMTIGPPTIVIIAEYKVPHPSLATKGLTLATVSTRATDPDQFDMRLNSHSRLPLIMALQEARRAGADEALMLDKRGFIASCNATNFFHVAGLEVRTSRPTRCFAGITRAKVIGLCAAEAIPLASGDFSSYDLADAEEAFVTGTFGGITPVAAIDGRKLTVPGPITQRLRAAYARLIDSV